PKEGLCAFGPDGRYAHEIVVPFVKSAPAERKAEERTVSAPRPVRRSFPPGTEWAYVKLYTGSSTADRVLVEDVAPVAKEALDSGVTDRWFFIRYADPEWHVRLRFHGDPRRLRGELLPALERATEPLLADGRLWRVAHDTYEREVDRYGGAEAIELAESVF